MKNLKSIFLLTVLAAVMLTACGSTETIQNTQWHLTNLAGQPALSATEVTLHFEKGSLNGSDGCNSFGGSYTTDGNNFKVGADMVSTLMACDEKIMAQSAVFYQALTQAATFKIDDSLLKLMDSNGSVLAVFEAKPN